MQHKTKIQTSPFTAFIFLYLSILMWFFRFRGSWNTVQSYFFPCIFLKTQKDQDILKHAIIPLHTARCTASHIFWNTFFIKNEEVQASEGCYSPWVAQWFHCIIDCLWLYLATVFQLFFGFFLTFDFIFNF